MDKTELEIPNPSQMREEIQTFVSEREALVAFTMAIHITDAPEKVAASDFLASTLLPLRKRIEDKRKTYSLTLRRLATEWDGEFKPALEAIDGLVGYVKSDIIRYDAQQEELRRKEQEELDRQAEAERKAAETRGEQPQIPEDIVGLAPVVEKTVRTDGGTTTVKKVPVVVITNEALIPRKYLMVDHRLLDPDVKSGVQVPGAKLDFRSEVAVMTR